MKSQQIEGQAERVRWPKNYRFFLPSWHRIYYLLVAFDVLVVLLGVTLNHQIIRTYEDGIAVNQEWVGRLYNFSKLEPLAGAVNEPGNEIFDSNNVDLEFDKFQTALRIYHERVSEIEREMQAKLALEEEEDSPVRDDVRKLLKDLAAIKSSMSEMTEEAVLIFSHFRQGQPELAAKRMAVMDRKYAGVRTTQAEFREHVSDIQDKLFARQVAMIRTLGKYELVIAAFLLLMVSGAAVYGYKTRKALEFDARVKEQYLTKLEAEVKERNQVAAAFEESQKRYQDLFENAKDIIYSHDLEGNYTSANKACQTITGYTEAEALRLNVGQVIAPDYLALAKDHLGRRSQDMAAAAYELEIISKNGRRIPLEVNTRLAFVDGVAVGVHGIARDITERKLAEKEREVISEVIESIGLTHNLDELLTSIHQSLKKVLFAENCFVALYDRKTGLFSMEFFVDEFDETPPPLNLEKSRTSYVFGKGQPVLMTDELLQQLVAEGKVQPDGTPPASWVGIPLATAEATIGVLVCQHYTDHHAYSNRNVEFLSSIGGQIALAIERKQVEEKLRESEEKYRTILDTLDDGYFEVDLKGDYIFLNDAFCRITGRAENELIGKSYKEFFELPTRQLLKEAYNNVYKTGEPLKAFQYELTKKDGSKRFVEESISLKRNVLGVPVAFMGIRRDCTDRKLAERELEEARNLALESARLKSEFLANMSHEIRTPMNGVIGMAGLLLDTELNEDQRDFAETIRSSGDSLLTIINDILDFSKIEAGKLQFEILDFDMAATVESTVELLAERARHKKLDLAALVHHDVPTLLRGDPGRLRQVLTNLIGNAIKFTEQGEVIVSAEKERETEETAIIRFSVTDTGIGIRKAAQRNLFQAFTQADGSTTRKYGGTGLGLAISRQLVELMGGEIGVTSEEGAGSTFWFTARFEKQPPGATHIHPLTADLRQLRVLVVDDNATTRNILSQQLSSWDMSYDEANSSLRGLAMLREAASQGTPYDLAILDLIMPEMDGFDLAREIKADPLIASVQLVLLTSYGQRGDGAKARSVGIAAYLTKPVRQSQLFDCLVSVIRGLNAADKSNDSSGRSTPLITKHALKESAVMQNPLILLAEDNIVNQKVAVRQLQKLGYRADYVANGREAVEALSRIPYDVILMDCQMPEMDGYEATAEIRRREGTMKHTIVVAMTANALQGDREKCLAAGMDDYISKPVKTEELARLLARILAVPEVQKDPDPEPPKRQAPPVDLERMHEAMGDEVTDIVELYLAQMSENLAKLDTAVESGDSEAVCLIAHNCVGTSANCGMDALVPPMRELEAIGREGRLAEAQPVIAEARTQFERITLFLRAELLQLA
jgi:PAS domain S-box-containing protein